ncbi:MAG: ABC transporter ATP-binding protein [Nanoarchaeota archaeon]|nr:ABC transporter ATP-binding protein [Nanoarchaeota archaeon]
MAQPIIKIEGVTKAYSTRVVLHDINLDINKGEIIGLMGVNGSGKSTLLNSIIGYLDPEEGKILFCIGEEAGKPVYVNVHRRKNLVRKLFGFAAQEPSYYKKLTVSENIDYFGALYGLKRKVRQTNMKTILELMELQECKNKLGENLSGGMQKRLDFACSLIHEPKVLLLDEPTSELDPILRKEIWSLIEKIKAKGTTIVIASHYIEEIEEMCDRVVVMTNGHIEVIGTPAHVKSAYGVSNLTKVLEKIEKKSKREEGQEEEACVC